MKAKKRIIIAAICILLVILAVFAIVYISKHNETADLQTQEYSEDVAAQYGEEYMYIDTSEAPTYPDY